MIRRIAPLPVAIAFDMMILIFFIIGVGNIISWFDYRAPVKVHFRVFKDLSVAPSSNFEYTNYFTRYRYCDTRVNRWFVTSEGAVKLISPLPSFMPTEALNMRQQSKAKIMLPWDMPEGVSQSCFQSEWRCTPLQRLKPIKGKPTCFKFIVDLDEEPEALWPPMSPVEWAHSEYADF